MLKRKARIITVGGGKGGTGKTFVAVNLAVELARQLPVREMNSKTISNSRVLLFDADYHLANSHLLLGIRQPSYLDKIVNNPKDIMEYLVTTDYGVDLINFGGDDKRVNSTEIKFNDAILKELNRLEEYYDYIVVDTGAGLNRTILNQIIFADQALLTINPESTSLLDAYKLIKFISLEKNRPKSLDICVNKAASVEEAQKAFRKLENTKEQFGLKMKMYLSGVIFSDKQLFDASLAKGIPAVVLNSGSAVAQSFRALAVNIQKNKFSKSVESFFEKIFIGSGQDIDDSPA